MEDSSLLTQAFVYLTAAVISVPIAKRLGFGSVLGYLVAGVIIGPFVFNLVGDQTDVMHFAEFGVVMMLFLVGLELRPSRLWHLRGPILGLGGLQVFVTTAAIMAIAMAFELAWSASLAIGMILALSSTAIVLQTLNERGYLQTQAGQSSFSVLLFQDIAFIPMFAILPLLAAPELIGLNESTHQTHGHQIDLTGWQQGLMATAIIVTIILAGHFLVRPVFRFIAESRLREIFTAAALLLIVGVAMAMQAVGLSPALGSFLAGVVLAESEYRHALESDIEPFKGLLLGLFFISVGASIDFALLFEQVGLIVALVLGLIILKLCILLALGRLFRLPLSENTLFSFSLAQGGEFAFVLFVLAADHHVLSPELTSILILVVAISMLCTPLMMIAFERLLQPHFGKTFQDNETDDIVSDNNPVIIAGFGRFGMIIGRLLHTQGIPTTVLDHDAAQIENLRKFGFKVFYGDATRLDLLHAAGAQHAKILVIALDDSESVIKLSEQVKLHYPHLTIMARATNRFVAYDLINHGIDDVYREVFDSALQAGMDALRQLGFHPAAAARAARKFKQYDEQALRELATLHHDEAGYMSRATELMKEIESLIIRDDETFLDQDGTKRPHTPPADKPVNTDKKNG